MTHLQHTATPVCSHVMLLHPAWACQQALPLNPLTLDPLTHTLHPFADSEGWFHTGDVGEMSGGGVLRIVDRKKNIFKLSQGEYIAVEKLEQVFKKCALVEELWVYGNSLESLLVAVVVPKRKLLLEWAAGRGVTGGWRGGGGRSSVLQCGVVPVSGCCSGGAALCAAMGHCDGSWLLLLLVQPGGHACTACVHYMCTPGRLAVHSGSTQEAACDAATRECCTCCAAGAFEEVCTRPEARQYVQQQMSAVGKAAGLKGFEDVKAVHLEAEVGSRGVGRCRRTCAAWKVWQRHDTATCSITSAASGAIEQATLCDMQASHAPGCTAHAVMPYSLCLLHLCLTMTPLTHPCLLPPTHSLQPFSVENGLLTPSFKLKRAPLLEHYKKQVDGMYKDLKALERVKAGAR
jgi:hypothetical protein